MNILYRRCFKRVIDIFFSSLALIILSPVFLSLFILIRIKMGRPSIFRQQRVGKGEKFFVLYKFRSMTDERDIEGKLLTDDLRVTSFGRKLRATSLDELPELINILKGDMSIIGPRPLPGSYLPLYNEKQKRRHEVLPGLSNISAISGRNTLKWEDKFDMDVWYVDNMSFILDCKIIYKTIIAVFKMDGATTANGGFRKNFTGSKALGNEANIRNNGIGV